MALKVWLPFNGNLKNHGLGLNGAGKGNITYSAGKIGQCIDFSANANVASGSENMVVIPGLQLPTFTFCAWIKVTSAATQDDQIIAREGQGYNTDGWSLIINKDTNKIAARASWISYTFSDTGEVNKWYHIAFTHANQINYWYFNGELIYSANCNRDVTYDTTTTSDGNVITFGARGRDGAYHWPFQGCINDFRLYDEALSPKQIKEISKGLVAHYKLDTMRAINNLKRNVAYGVYNNFSSSGSTCTVVATGEYYNGSEIYRMTYTPNDTSLSNVQTSLHGHGVTTSGMTFTAGTKYCYWTLFKPISHPDTIAGGIASNIGYWTEIPMQEYGGGWYIVGQKRTGNAPEDRSDTIFTSFKTPSAESGVPIIIDFCCPHLVSGYDYILPEFNYQGTNLTYEPDSSGNNYNGIINGILSYNNDSPRYSGSTTLTNAYISSPAGTVLANSKDFTINGWFYHTSGTNYYASVESYNTSVCLENGRFFVYPASGGAYVGTWSATNNIWQMLTLVHNSIAKTLTLYVNGAQTAQITTDGTIYPNETLNIGGRQNAAGYTGSMSDFRIYATALSADDILTLYKTSGIIDNKSNVYAYEFKEE